MMIRSQNFALSPGEIAPALQHCSVLAAKAWTCLTILYTQAGLLCGSDSVNYSYTLSLRSWYSRVYLQPVLTDYHRQSSKRHTRSIWGPRRQDWSFMTLKLWIGSKLGNSPQCLWGFLPPGKMRQSCSPGWQAFDAMLHSATPPGCSSKRMSPPIRPGPPSDLQISFQLTSSAEPKYCLKIPMNNSHRWKEGCDQHCGHHLQNESFRSWT